MEAILFLIDSIAITLVVFFSVKNDRLRAGAMQTGLFRFKHRPDDPGAGPGRGAGGAARRG